MDLTKHGFVEMEVINILHSGTGLEKADLSLLTVIISSC